MVNLANLLREYKEWNSLREFSLKFRENRIGKKIEYFRQLSEGLKELKGC